MATASPRILAVAVGEATWDRLHRFGSGLPYLSGLEASGARGTTLASQPLDVATNWANIITGRSPAAHGVFTSLVPDGHGGRRYTRADDLGAPPLWHLLGAAGVPSGVFNVDLADPADAGPATSFLVTHDPRPRVHSGVVYPPEVYADLTGRFGRWESGASDRTPEEWKEMTDREATVQVDVIAHLLTTRPWRFALVHLHEVAKAQHRFWDDGTDRLEWTYQRADRSLARLAEAVGPDTLLFVFSECGAGPIRSSVHLNVWLEQEGFLRRRHGAVQHAGRGLARLQRRVRAILPRSELLSRLKVKVFGKVSASNVDWDRTRAFAPGDTDQILLLGPPDERASLASEITERLLALRDPDGHRVVERVIQRDEWHSAWEHTPDLLVVWSDDAYVPTESFSEDAPVFEGWMRAGDAPLAGSHRRHGVVLVGGRGVPPVDLGTVGAIDLAPTWFDLLGVPVPVEFEGKSFADRLRS